MINGVVNIRKEPGMTSFGVVARIRRIIGQKKLGHAGTLDPDAEGVLPVCLGKATKLVELLQGGGKTYEAERPSAILGYLMRSKHISRARTTLKKRRLSEFLRLCP